MLKEIMKGIIWQDTETSEIIVNTGDKDVQKFMRYHDIATAMETIKSLESFRPRERSIEELAEDEYRRIRAMQICAWKNRKGV